MDNNVLASLKASSCPGPFFTFITNDWRSLFEQLKNHFINIQNVVRSKPVPLKNIHKFS